MSGKPKQTKYNNTMYLGNTYRNDKNKKTIRLISDVILLTIYENNM